MQSDGSSKHDYYLGQTGAAEVSLMELARVAKAEHRIEECLQRGKSEAGLGDYQVRNWVGWHHHLTLSLVATWFLESAYFALLATAYRRSELSLVYPVARGLAPVLVLLFAAVVLGAQSTALQVVGVALVAVGVLLVRGLRGKADPVGLAMAIGIAGCIASYTIVDRQGVRFASPAAYVELALIVPAALYLAAVLRWKGRAAVRRELVPSTVVAAIALFAAYAFVLTALTLGPTASVAAIRESSVAIATVLAAVTLRERVAISRVAGAVLVVAGVAALAVG